MGSCRWSNCRWVDVCEVSLGGVAVCEVRLGGVAVGGVTVGGWL